MSCWRTKPSRRLTWAAKGMKLGPWPNEAGLRPMKHGLRPYEAAAAVKLCEAYSRYGGETL